MKAYNARIAGVTVGLSRDAVEDLLGPPNGIESRGDSTGPSDVFRSLGSEFRFPDESADVVWMYADPYRPRIRHYIGFKDESVCATWKETLTQERLEQLKSR